MRRFARARPTAPPPEPLDTKAPLARAYQAVHEPAKEKKAEQFYDRNAERISSTSEKLTLFNDFCHENQSVIARAIFDIASVDIDSKSIETAINGFTETAKVVMKGLDALAQVHPFVAVAVTAFKGVISLDISRRENNKKIQVLHLDMQDLACMLFRLPQIKDTGPDRLSVEGRLQGIIDKIAEHVTDCGLICDLYMKKPFLAKVITSKIYEERLAGCAKSFKKDRMRLMERLAINTSSGVDEANKKLHSVEDKLDKMMNLLFRKLESSQEKDVRKFIKDSGGEEACIHTDHLLIRLLEKGGEPLAAGDHHITGKRIDDLGVARDKLSRELSEDIREAIKNNMGLFKEKLEAERKQLQNSIDKAESRIITAVFSGAHASRILDPDLREIWRDMGWKGSVKARHFVFALHDYYAEKFAKASRAGNSPASPLTDYPGTPLPLANSEMDDQWVLPYLDVPHVQAILEAIDDDGTGFITINEVNTFTESRPKHSTFRSYSLLQGIAYWAAGWHLSVSDYKNKIYVLVKRIFTLVEDVLPANKHIADTSLFDPCFWGLERLLRSTQSISGDVASTHPELAILTKQYNKYEESRLKAGLANFRYELDTAATVALVTGPGRIGRYLYPLLFLLLRRYIKIMKLASKHILHVDEFTIITRSIKSILQAVDERIRVLVAVFKQSHLDVRSRIGNVAFGMFQLIFDGVERNPSTYSFFDWEDTLEEMIDDDDADKISPRYDFEDKFEYDEYVPQPSIDDAWTSINGLWAGNCYAYGSDDTRHKGLLQITVNLAAGGSSITGNGEGRSGLLTINGTVTIDESGTDSAKVALMLSYKDGYTMRCNGIFDPQTDTIKGDWSLGRVVESDDEDLGKDSVPKVVPAEGGDRGANDIGLAATALRTFEFTRTPSHFYKFRHKLGSQPTAKSRWSFACSAIRQQVRQQLWSWRHIQAHCHERQRFMDLIMRRRIHRDGYTPFEPLLQSEVAELANLEHNICPSDTRLYTLCVDLKIRKIPHHLWFFCDACERQIIHTRIICATCTSADLSDNIDLCSSCADQTPSRDKFNHKISHILVQTDRVLHDYNLASIIREANVIASRVKSDLRSLQNPEHKKAAEAYETFARPTSEMLCKCCGKAVTTPFWVCIECTASDTYICYDCNSKRKSPSDDNGHEVKPPLDDNGHKVNHFLAQVYDSKEIVEVDAVDPRFQSMERRIIELESKVQRHFESLESNINARLATLEEKLAA